MEEEAIDHGKELTDFNNTGNGKEKENGERLLLFLA